MIYDLPFTIDYYHVILIFYGQDQRLSLRDIELYRRTREHKGYAEKAFSTP